MEQYYNPARQLVDEVREFAEAAARASKLPGGQFGPRDAFRHMVGTAELVRRAGLLTAYGVVEGNELRSLAYEQWRRANRENVAASLRSDSRNMDRANNAVGLRIGARSTTPDEVIQAARTEIMRAHQLGPVSTGSGDRASWMPPAR
jgi:hypothetical protein